MKLMIFLALFSLISCMGKGGNNNETQEQLVQCACQPETEAVITSNQAIPEKISMKINNQLIFNECSPVEYGPEPLIERNEKSGKITVRGNLFLIETSDVTITDCQSNNEFYFEANAKFDIRVLDYYKGTNPKQPSLYQAKLSIF